MTTVETCIQ